MIIGGQGTLIGPVAGSIIVNFLTELLRPIGTWRMVAYAALIIVMMWVRPQGLAGASNSILAERTIGRKRVKKEAAS
jgi:branched-chain amino acid transport system permease protein